MASLFSRKEVLPTTSVKGKVVTIFNPAGSSPVGLIEKLATVLDKRNESTVVVELPCVGIPRVAYQIGITELDSEQTIDQLMIDYDRDMLKAMNSYVRKYPLFDGILIQPRSRPDLPTLLKIQKQNTLIELPSYLKSNLSAYQNIILLVQGQLFHPMTFFAVRNADHVILGTNEVEEVIRAFATYKVLIDEYGLSESGLTLFSEIRNTDFKEAPIVSKVSDLPTRWKQTN